MLNAICQAIDTVQQAIGKILSLLIIVITVLVTVDVTLRYIFNSPVLWGWDINIQLFGILSVFGGGFALLHNAHIGVDALLPSLSSKTRAILRIIMFPVFFLGVGILMWEAIPAAWDSLLSKERYSSYIAPPIYPLKIAFVIGIALLLFQGIANFVRDIRTAIHEREEPCRSN